MFEIVMETSDRAARRQEGSTLRFGKYELVKPLGIGGMALVWLATKPILGGSTKICALKMPADLIGLDQHKREAILNEIRIASQLSHSNIVQVFDAGNVGGVTYIELECIDGVSLERFIDAMHVRGVAWSFSFACHIVREILEGLHYAHTFEVDGVVQAVVHRDISPHNVLVSSAGEIKIMDFGIAKVHGDRTSGIHLKGKLGYMAPELLREDAGPSADLFAVGAVLYELVEGKRFREGRSIEDTVVRTVTEPRPEITRVAVPEAIVRLYRGLTEPDPKLRIRSADEALQMIASWNGGGSEKDGLRYLYRRCFGDARYSGRTEGCVEMPHELAAILVALQGGDTPSPMEVSTIPSETTATSVRPGPAPQAAEASTVALPKEEPEIEAETTVHVRPSLATLARQLAHAGIPEGELEPGAVVGMGRFRIERVIGRGGMATVYAACALAEMQMVAIKVPSPDARDGDGETRFANELLFGGIVGEHPNFVLPLHAGKLPELGDVPYLATELARGPALADVIAMERRLPPSRALGIARDVARALEYLHQRGIVHRDVKPDNVLLVETNSGEIAKLIDLGLATRAQRQDSARITAFHERPGTRPYMSPEQLAGEPARPSLDVFALGVTLHEMLLGTPPPDRPRDGGDDDNDDDDDDEWMTRVELPADAPAGLAEIVDACLARDPRRRPAAGTVRRWLDELVAEPESPPEQRRRVVAPPEPVRAGASQSWGLVAVVAVGLLFGAAFHHQQTDEVPQPLVRSGPPSQVDSQTRAIQASLARALASGDLPPTTSVAEPAAPLEGFAPPVAAKPPAAPYARRPTYDENRCPRVRRAAAAAIKNGEHDRVLALVQHRECWSDDRLRVQTEVRALAGSRRFARCFDLGKRYEEDPRIRTLTAFCAARRAKQG